MAKGKHQDSVSSKPGSSAVKQCSCQHDFQDDRFGKGMRLKIIQADGKWECSVCGRS